MNPTVSLIKIFSFPAPPDDFAEESVLRFILRVVESSVAKSRVKLVELKPLENGVQAKTEATIEIDGTERPAAVVESLVRLYG